MLVKLMKGIIITTEGEKYEPGSTQTVVVDFTEEQRIGEDESLKLFSQMDFSEKMEKLRLYRL